jgi:hypothetical protein
MAVNIYDIEISCQQFGHNLSQQIHKNFLFRESLFTTAICLLDASIYMFYRLPGAVFELEIKFNLKANLISRVLLPENNFKYYRAL